MYFDGVISTRCPLRPFKDEPVWYNNVVESFGWVKKDFLPERGTWKDQPAKLLDCFAVMEKVFSDIREREDRKREAKAGKGA